MSSSGRPAIALAISKDGVCIPNWLVLTIWLAIKVSLLGIISSKSWTIKGSQFWIHKMLGVS